MGARLAWETEGLTEGWRLTLPSGEKSRIRCSICESSGGGLRQAVNEARDLGYLDDIYAVVPEHNRFDGSRCCSNTCLTTTSATYSHTAPQMCGN